MSLIARWPSLVLLGWLAACTGTGAPGSRTAASAPPAPPTPAAAAGAPAPAAEAPSPAADPPSPVQAAVQRARFSLSEMTVVASVLPLHGPLAAAGAPLGDGVNLAWKLFDPKRFADDKPALVAFDTNSHQISEPNAVLLLDKTAATPIVIGAVHEDVTRALATMVASRPTVLLAPLGARPDTLAVAPRSFALFPSNTAEGEAAALWARGRGWKRAAIVSYHGDHFSEETATGFARRFQAEGGKVTIAQEMEPNSAADTAAWAVARTRPDVVYVAVYSPDAERFFAAAAKHRLEAAAIGFNQWDDPELTNRLGPTRLPTYYVASFAPDDPAPATAAFVASWNARHDTPPDVHAAGGHDAMAVALDALARAGTTDPDQVAAAVASTRLDLAAGTLEFGVDRVARRSMVVIDISDGTRRFVERIPAVEPGGPPVGAARSAPR